MYYVNLTLKENGNFGLYLLDEKVTRVRDGSPASKSKIEAGDRMFAINGKIIKNKDDINSLLQRSGSFLGLTLYRRGKI